MQRHLNLVLLIFLLGFSAHGEEPTGALIPDQIFAWGDHPQFVALDRAVDPSGQIDPDVLIHPSRAVYLRNDLDAPVAKTGCVEFKNFSSSDIPGHSTFQSALVNQNHVLLGRVLDMRPGWKGRLGIVLLIETEEVLVGDPEHRFFVFSPKGRFTFQEKAYCLDHDYFPDLPKIGDRILVAYLQHKSGPMIPVESTGLVTLPETGSPSIGNGPPKISDAPEVDPELAKMETSDDIITWVRNTLRKVGKL